MRMFHAIYGELKGCIGGTVLAFCHFCLYGVKRILRAMYSEK